MVKNQPKIFEVVTVRVDAGLIFRAPQRRGQHGVVRDAVGPEPLNTWKAIATEHAPAWRTHGGGE